MRDHWEYYKCFAHAEDMGTLESDQSGVWDLRKGGDKPSFCIRQSKRPAAASRLSGNQSDKLQGFGDSVPDA